MPAREAGATGQRQVFPEPSDLDVLRVRNDGQCLGEFWNSHAFSHNLGHAPFFASSYIAASHTDAHFDDKLLHQSLRHILYKSVVMVMISLAT